ncbi:MAG: phosphoadenylyl-sulfate reductase [Candidatus Caenarcaniphilales bacterium]|jgi:phosphoadenosine phosphosulfate reductase|nr:phosphoadenylyl-sulfate reductase [Candidatus Caenarcaniphilales bacterium]
MLLFPKTKEEWDKLGEELDSYSAEKVLEEIVKRLSNHGEILFLTAFGPEGCVILEILSKIDQAKQIKIANLDTGYQFQETLELKDKFENKYNLSIQIVSPELSVAEQDERYGKNLFERDPDQCCYMRKLVPLNKLLEGKYAWISSIRKEQTEVRAKSKIIEFDNKFQLGKINPLVNWTKSDVWKYIHENQIPYNLLLDKGYDSIGCEPCTKPGQDREGRWAGKDKVECGLHLQDTKQGGEYFI